MTLVTENARAGLEARWRRSGRPVVWRIHVGPRAVTGCSYRQQREPHFRVPEDSLLHHRTAGARQLSWSANRQHKEGGAVHLVGRSRIGSSTIKYCSPDQRRKGPKAPPPNLISCRCALLAAGAGTRANAAGPGIDSKPKRQRADCTPYWFGLRRCVPAAGYKYPRFDPRFVSLYPRCVPYRSAIRSAGEAGLCTRTLPPVPTVSSCPSQVLKDRQRARAPAEAGGTANLAMLHHIFPMAGAPATTNENDCAG
jgi:hypothetical protein